MVTSLSSISIKLNKNDLSNNMGVHNAYGRFENPLQQFTYY